MRKWLLGSVALSAAAVTLALAVPAWSYALAIAMPMKPGPNRVATTDTIIVGRVMGMEDVDVKVPVAPGQQATQTYRIAIVSVTDVIKGKADLKRVRVGFVPLNNGGPGGGPGGGPIGRPGFGPVQLQTGQEGLFYLSKHPTGDFLTVNGQFDFIPGQNKDEVEKEIAEAKHAIKLMDNPMEGLKSKDQKDRYLTAALLITKYRTPHAGSNKTEKISAEESKLILQALAEADWKAQPIGGGIKGRPGFDPMGPMNLFGMLGVTQQDGFTPPQKITTPQDYPNYCRDWCQQNAGKYQIQRFVEK
jgi:hypothetical protein